VLNIITPIFLKNIIYLLFLFCAFSACKGEGENKEAVSKSKPKPKPVYKYGFKVADYKVILDTIKSGESFGAILDRHQVKLQAQ
jgi:murein DD-endopeptidase